MCRNEPDVTDIHSTGFGDMERAWLHLIRLQCMGYEHNLAEGWDRAIGHAEMQYGADVGPEIASRIAVLIRALRAERQGGFGYLSPFCPNCRLRVTEDEWQLIILMQAGYHGDPGSIEDAAAEFARRSDAPVLVAAATRFGSTFAATVCPRQSTAAPGATLH